MRTLLADGAIDFEGTYVQAREAELLPAAGAAGRTAAADRLQRPPDAGRDAPVRRRLERLVRGHRQRAGGRRRRSARRSTRPPSPPAAIPPPIERTVAVLVRLPGGTGRVMGDTDPKQAVAPLEGPPEVIAEALRAYAREGIGHVQLVLDPDHRGFGRRPGAGARGARSWLISPVGSPGERPATAFPAEHGAC